MFSNIANYIRLYIFKWKHPAFWQVIMELYSSFQATKLDNFLSEEVVLSLQKQIFEDLCKIYSSEDPRMACRQRLDDSIREFTNYEVLLMDINAEDDFTGFVGTQGVTGKLHLHLIEIIKNNTQLREMIYECYEEPTYEEILSLLKIMRLRNFWIMERYNSLRKALGDYHEISDEDWYGPYIHARCVCSEYQYRMGAGLKTPIDIVEFIMYATFETFVEKGRQFPDQAWRNHYRDSIEDGTLYPPFKSN